MGCTGSSSDAAGKPGFSKEYVLSDENLGTGAVGTVSVCTHRVTNESYAVKKISFVRDDKETILDAQGKMDTQEYGKAAARREAALLQKLGRHEHCVELVQFFEEPQVCYFLIELCERSVLDVCVENGIGEEANVALVLLHILRALAFLHDHGVVHRDAKPSNFLVKAGRSISIGTVVKLCDFGLAAELPEWKNRSKSTRGFDECYGSPPFMAPEIVCEQRYGEKVDIWSCGVSAYVILFGAYPYIPLAEGSTPKTPKSPKSPKSPSSTPKSPSLTPKIKRSEQQKRWKRRSAPGLSSTVSSDHVLRQSDPAMSRSRSRSESDASSSSVRSEPESSFNGAMRQLPRRGHWLYPAKPMMQCIKENMNPPGYIPIPGFPFPSQVALSFLRALLKRDPEDRASANSALKFPFLLEQSIRESTSQPNDIVEIHKETAQQKDIDIAMSMANSVILRRRSETTPETDTGYHVISLDDDQKAKDNGSRSASYVPRKKWVEL